MPKRSAHTLLLIKPDLIARADFGPLPKLELLGCWSQAQSGNVRLYHAVEGALHLGDITARNVWVMGEDFWTQTLSLPRPAVAGLNHEQLRKAIGFDVESLTGLSVADSDIGFCAAAPPDDAEHVWVVQVSAAARSQVQMALDAAGARMAGLVHPGGVPGAVDPSADGQPWRRVEIWKSATLCMTGSGRDRQHLRILNGDPGREAWRASLTRWIAAHPAQVSEWLGPSDALAKSWTTYPVLTDETLKPWMMRWAAELTGGAKHVPVIQAVPSTAFTRKHAVAAVVLALLTLLACYLRGRSLDAARAQAANDLHDVLAPRQQLNELNSRAANLQAQIDRLHVTPAHGTPLLPDSEIHNQQFRVENLLAELAHQSNAQLVIRKIDADAEGKLTLSGQCLPSTSADEFARRLAAELPALGWQISPAQKIIPSGGNIRGTCEFQLELTPDAPGGKP